MAQFIVFPVLVAQHHMCDKRVGEHSGLAMEMLRHNLSLSKVHIFAHFLKQRKTREIWNI